MAVEKNDFRHLMAGQLTSTTQMQTQTQTQHMFGMLPLTMVTNYRLAGKERLKPFAL